MRKKTPPRISKTLTVSLPPDVAEFIDKRAAEIGSSSSKYIADLVRHDREENTVGEIAKKQAERLSTPVAA